MNNVFRVSHIVPPYLMTFRQVKYQQNMKNEGTICNFARGKHGITSLSLTYKISTACQFIKYQGKQKLHMTEILVLINN